MKINQSESEIKANIQSLLQVLENHLLLYFVRNNTASVNLGGRHMTTGKVGSPDIIACVNGKFVGLEVKNTKGKTSSAQEYTRDLIHKCHGEYHVVQSTDDVLRVLAAHGITP